MKRKFIEAYMDVAQRFADLSTAKRLKVGAILVKEDRIISIGYNGMPSGWDNLCEEVIPEQEEVDFESRTVYTYPEQTVTRPEVIHAEMNCIAKLAKCGESGKDSIMFLTHAPCMQCAKHIYTAGIKSVYYRDVYRDMSGIDFLIKCGVDVWHEPKKQ